MTEDRSLAAWFAFAGGAFLSPEPAQIAPLLSELRNNDLPAGLPADLAEQFAQVLPADPIELEKEYVRLFLNPAGAPCPPWQSAQDDEPQLMGSAHRSALAWYRAAGVQPRAATEPADHIGLLLAFYARLLESDSPPEIRRAFCDEHLAWVVSFCDRLLAATNHRFYGLLAETARRLVAAELGRVRPAGELLVGESEPYDGSSLLAPVTIC